MQVFIATFHSSLSAWVILAPIIFMAGMAVAMRTAHNIIRYTMAETTNKWVPKSSNQRCMAEIDKFCTTFPI